MSLHPLFKAILAPLETPVKPHRFARQQMLENELALFAADYCEAMELLDAMQCGLEGRIGDLDPDLAHAFKRLREALDEADDKIPYEPDPYQPE
jgi:uncharacterized membrane protein YccC